MAHSRFRRGLPAGNRGDVQNDLVQNDLVQIDKESEYIEVPQSKRERQDLA